MAWRSLGDVMGETVEEMEGREMIAERSSGANRAGCWKRAASKDIENGARVRCLANWPTEALPVGGSSAPIPQRVVTGVMRGSRVVLGSISVPAHAHKKVSLEVWVPLESSSTP